LIQLRIALTTAGTREEEEKIARSLVQNQFAACVNLLPQARSIYRWQGQVEEADEVLLIIKTEDRLVEAVNTEIRRLHSYELPEFLVLSPQEGGQEYLEWVASSLRSG
jgi:periplasmic divalent cation tolerance protein